MTTYQATLAVKITRLQLLFDGLPMAIGGNLLLAVTMLVVLWGDIQTNIAITWLLSMILLQGVRLGVWSAFSQHSVANSKSADFWLTRFRFFVIASGMLWGVASWYFFPSDVMHQFFLAFVLVGLSAGAIITLATDKISILSFTLLVMGPLILNFVFQAGGLSVMIGALSVMFMMVFTSSIARLRKTLLGNELLIQESYLRQQELDNQQQLVKIIASIQSQFISEADRHETFVTLVSEINKLTGSKYGFIGHLNDSSEANKTYLTVDAIDYVHWSDKKRVYYQENVRQGMKVYNPTGLLDTLIKSKQPFILNNPDLEPAEDGLPTGHSKLYSFTGIPIYHGDEVVAFLGLANRPEGYDESLIAFLHPLMLTIGQLIDATRIQQQHDANQLLLARLSRVASQTTNGVVITDIEGNITWANEGYIRITGYNLDELLGQKPGALLQGPNTSPVAVETMRAALLSQESFNVDVLNYSKEKRPYWIRIQCSPLRGDDGELQGYMAIESDVTVEKHAEKGLRETTKLLEGILENVPSMIFLKDADELSFRYLNRAGETLLGQKREALIGHNDHDFFPKEQADFFTRKDREILQLHEAVDIPREMIETAAGTRILHTRKIALHDELDKPQYLLGISQDITESIQAAETLKSSEVRLRGLFELSPIGIALNDYETGAFIQINEALYKPAGYTRDEFMKLRYWDITPIEYHQQESVQLDLMDRKGRYGPYEKELIRKDGSRYPVVLNGMVLFDNNGRKLIWSIIEDISERKRIDRMKNEFIATVSHELRTPVTSITGALGLMLGGVTGELSQQAHDIVEIAYKNSQRLGILINDLLDMEKLVSGKMDFVFERQPLKPLLEQAIRENHAYVERFNAHVLLSVCDEHIWVNVDAQRLLQILTNLISNAAKFSPYHGIVDISAEVIEQHVRVAISDQGEGIPDEFRARIFEKFAQADSSDTRMKGGSGLGLSITQQLVEKMGGSIGFDSVLGQGTTFYFELPLAGVGRRLEPHALAS